MKNAYRAKYSERAGWFDRLAADATIASLRTRYSNIADWYRLLADERKRLIETGELETEAPSQSN
jgi:hypothetical protein